MKKEIPQPPSTSDPSSITDKDILEQMLHKTKTSDPNKQYNHKELKNIYLKLRAQLRKEQNDTTKGIFQGKSNKKFNACEDGISWGLIDDDEVYQMAQEDEDNKLIILDYHALRLLPNLTDKQIQKIDQAEQKKNKLESLEKELEQLQNQEQKSFGLEEGKKRRKEAMESKLNEYLLDFEMAEENLKFLLFGEKTSKSQFLLIIIFKEKIGKIQDEDTYGDDEFFDRTHKQIHKSDQEIISRILKQQNQQQQSLPLNTPSNYDFANVENFETLQKKLQFFVDERNKLNLQFLDIQENEINENNKIIDDGDDLGLFLKENERKLIGEKKKEHLEKLQFIQNQIEKTKALLQLSKPGAVIQEPSVQNQPQKKDNKKEDQIKIPKPKSKQEQSNISKTLQQLKEKSKAFHNATHIEDPNSDDLAQYIPALKQLEQEETRRDIQHRDRLLLDQRIKKVEDEEEQIRQKLYSVKKKPKVRNLTEAEIGEEIASGWKPPSNQTGDGKTSLNDKLGY